MKFFLSALLSLLSIGLFAQQLLDPGDFTTVSLDVATIENIACDVETNELSFDLTVTNDGTPIAVTSSMGFQVVLISTGVESAGANVFSASTGSSTEGEPLSSLPVSGSLNDPFDCNNVEGLTVVVENAAGTNLGLFSDFPAAAAAAPSAAIPTLGEWGLIILVICLSVIGLVKIRSMRTIQV